MNQSLLIIIVSIITTAILFEFIWVKLRKKGHKDLWDILSDKQTGDK